MTIRWRWVAYACIFMAGDAHGTHHFWFCSAFLVCALVSFWFYKHGYFSDKENV